MIKLSQRDNDTVQIGDKFQYFKESEGEWKKNDIFEVIEMIDATKSCKVKNLRNNKTDTYSTRDWLNACKGTYQCLKRFDEKPHEYSPVNMTMYYRTIGD